MTLNKLDLFTGTLHSIWHGRTTKKNIEEARQYGNEAGLTIREIDEVLRATKELGYRESLQTALFFHSKACRYEDKLQTAARNLNLEEEVVKDLLANSGNHVEQYETYRQEAQKKQRLEVFEAIFALYQRTGKHKRMLYISGEHVGLEKGEVDELIKKKAESN